MASEAAPTIGDTRKAGRRVYRSDASARARFVLLSAGAVIAALAGCNDSSLSSGEPGAVRPPEVGVISLQPQPVPVTASLAGRVVALATAEIRPQVGGIVKQRVFKEGGEVAAGDLLYEIDPTSYQAALDAAEATLAKAQAALPSVQSKYDRMTQLSNASVTDQQRVEALAAVQQAKADVAAAEADVESARINLGYTQVTAPIPGLIGTSSVSQGALVTAGQTSALAVIRQIDPIYVDLSESSANLLRIRRLIGAQKPRANALPPVVKLTLEDGTAFEEAGSIESLESAVSETTGSLSVRARFPNPDRMLLPGMYVRAVVDVRAEQQAFLVPQRAVSRNPKGEATALFVGADGKAESRILDAARAYGNAWVVTENVAPGDRLIVDGLQKARVGEEVHAVAVELGDDGLVKEAAASQAPAAAN